VSQAPDYVSLVDSGSLVDWLDSLPPRLSQAQVVQAYDVLRWSDAWTAAAPAPTVPDTTRALALERGLGLRHVPTTPAVPGPPPVAAPTIAPAPVAAAAVEQAAVAPVAPEPVAEPDAEPAAPARRSRARTGPSGGRRSRPERSAEPRRGSRGRTNAAVVASLMLVLLVAPSIITGVQRSMSEPTASASQTPLPVSTLAPAIGGPCAPPDEITSESGEELACNQANGTWALRGTTAVLGERCTKADALGWSVTKNRPLVCTTEQGKLVWQVRTG
jgi:hypothetical protein